MDEGRVSYKAEILKFRLEDSGIWDEVYITDLPKGLTRPNLTKHPAWDAAWKMLKENVERRIRGDK